MALQLVVTAISFMSKTVVHPVWFPFALAPTTHAARTSIGYQLNAKRSSSRISWGTYLAGYLVMAWGGTALSHIILGLPPPMFYSFRPLINYLTVHLFMTWIFNTFPDLLNPRFFDTALWPVDAILRTNSVVNSLNLLKRPGVHPEYTNSPLMHIVLGAIASGGGGTMAGTLTTWASSWAFATPGPLREGAGWTGTLDLWGGSLVAIIYSTATEHPAFLGHSSEVTPLFLSAHTLWPFKASLDSSSAAAVGCVVLAILFAVRAYTNHWQARVKANPPRSLRIAKEKKGKVA